MIIHTLPRLASRVTLLVTADVRDVIYLSIYQTRVIALLVGLPEAPNPSILMLPGKPAHDLDMKATHCLTALPMLEQCQRGRKSRAPHCSFVHSSGLSHSGGTRQP